jgi:hypothetical protein
MDFNSAYTDTMAPGNPPTYTISKTASNSTRVGSINPWFGFTDNAAVFTAPVGDANHPQLPSASRSVFPQAHCAAVTKKIYQTYCDLYDEVKLDQMQVTLSILDPLGSATFPSMSIATGWDRKAALNETVETYDWIQNRVPGSNDVTAYPPATAARNYDLLISTNYPRSYDALVAGPAASESTASTTLLQRFSAT